MSTETTPTSIGIDPATLTPSEAEAKLSELTANTEAGRAWSAKWLGGDPATVAEFKSLVEVKIPRLPAATPCLRSLAAPCPTL